MAGSQTEIREGFLCPMCMKDLGTVSQLQDHFEEAHTSEDKAVLHQLRGLFDKAKKRILGEKDEELFETAEGSDGRGYRTSAEVGGTDPALWEPQEDGVTRSWTDNFRAVRGARVDRFVVETNKLLIRLDRLVGTEAPADPGKRKAFEKSVVPWVSDSDVDRCPTCGKSFSMLSRRRHHCRVCGGIMCDKCSQFLAHDFAKKLTDPAFQFTRSSEGGFLKRSDSNSSLNSMQGPDGDLHIRTCINCRTLLERRDQVMEQRNTKPTIVLLYEKMKGCIQEAEVLLTEFLPILECLSTGNATHSLHEAQQYRTRLVKLYEMVDLLSKKILSLGMADDPLPHPKRVLLQKSIRSYACNFMQDNMTGLQKLPTKEEYDKLQEARKRQVQSQIAAERLASFEAQEREKRLVPKEVTQKAMPTQGGATSRTVDERDRTGSQVKAAGWKPSSDKVRMSDSDNPMIQQMDIIRGYIKQAKQAEKWDEVDMLENNLKELQREFHRQQRP